MIRRRFGCFAIRGSGAVYKKGVLTCISMYKDSLSLFQTERNRSFSMPLATVYFLLTFNCVYGIISIDFGLRFFLPFSNRLLFFRCKMQKWYENRALLNTFIGLMGVSFIAYFFFHWKWGMPLFLALGTAIMIRGVVKITMRMRANKTCRDSHNKDMS